MKVQVLVRLKPGVLDVQGKAIERNIKHIGFDDVSNVRIGRLVELEVSDGEDAEKKVESLCKELLANPIIEDYEICSVE